MAENISQSDHREKLLEAQIAKLTTEAENTKKTIMEQDQIIKQYQKDAAFHREVVALKDLEIQDLNVRLARSSDLVERWTDDLRTQVRHLTSQKDRLLNERRQLLNSLSQAYAG